MNVIIVSTKIETRTEQDKYEEINYYFIIPHKYVNDNNIESAR